MWAFDLEKRQHRFASGELKKLKPYQTLAFEGQEDLLVENEPGSEKKTL